MAQNPNISKLDPGQILKRVYDEANDQIRTEVAIDLGGTSIEISQTDDSIRIGDGTNLITATQISGKTGLDTTIIGGVITATGLKTGLKTQTMTITDVATKVPPTALSNRNNITIRVWGDKVVYFGASDVTSSNGYPKFQYEEISMDIKDDMAVEVWAVCATGESCVLKIMEIA